MPQILKYGRDKNGQYKDQKHFVHLRNKINTLEQGHQALFERINKRLRDDNFLESHDSMLLEIPTMTNTDTQCYKERYADVTVESQADIQNHYNTEGKLQGRLNTCANNITNYQAEFLLEKTPALQRMYGSDIEQVRLNYTSYGSSALTTYDVTPGYGQHSPFFCGTDMPNTPFKKDKCNCDGTMYYGLKNDLISNKTLDFETIRHWSFLKKTNKIEEANYMAPDCTSFTFGGDPFPGQTKQCFCENKPIHYPNKCADEGEDCMCSGDVYFMSNEVDGVKNPHYIKTVN